MIDSRNYLSYVITQHSGVFLNFTIFIYYDNKTVY